MSEPFLAELRMFSFPFAPKGWALCNGQLLAIAQNQALFSLLGTTYGGNGQTTFGLPDLRGRTSMHIGNGLVQGQAAGEVAHTLIMSEMPAHTHLVTASSSAPNTAVPANSFFASNTGVAPYSSTINTTMAPDAVGPVGGNQAHNNMSPYLVISVCIALVGVFPSRN